MVDGASEALQAGDAFARGGQPQRALEAWRSALAAQPGSLPAHARLAMALLEMRRYHEAEPHFQFLLDACRDDATARLGLAYALQRQGRYRDAADHYLGVLSTGPGNVQALMGLGSCRRSLGEHAEACDCFTRALAADPACVDAWYALAMLRRFAPGDPLPAQCEALQVKVAGMVPKQQAKYWFALGKMREDRGDYPGAFNAYTVGNRAHAAGFVLDESGEDAWLRHACALFDRARMHIHPPSRDGTTRVPVFVVGMPRSGSTLIEQILASHPRVHGAGEITDLADLIAARTGAGDAWPDAVAALPPPALRELGEAYVERVWRSAPQASHVVNKLPLNYRHVGAIRMLLPQARVIHSMRDPLDTCLSCYARLFEGDNLAYTYDLGSLGRYYQRYAAMMRHWRSVLPYGAMLEVRYEDVVGDTEAQVRRMLDYLGLGWDPACLAFHRNTRVVATASRVQVREPIHRGSVGRWKRFEAQLHPLRDQLGLHA